MSEEVESIVRGAISRPLTDDEFARLGELLPERAGMLALVGALREAETFIAEETTRRFLAEHPDFSANHAYAWEKCVRDMRFFIRGAVGAILLEDMAMLSRFMRVFYIAAEGQVGITPNEVADSLRLMHTVVLTALAEPVDPSPFEEALNTALKVLVTA